MIHLRTIIFLALVFTTTSYHSQEIISSGRLSITIQENEEGVGISSIKDNNTEILNTTSNPSIFSLQISNINTLANETIGSSSSWGNINITNNETNGIIELSNPINSNLPSTLKVNVIINTTSEKSSWDLSVMGLGSNYSLLEVIFPQLNIKADGNDTFLYPLYSGKLTTNPGDGIDYFDDPNDFTDNIVGLYPRGWGTSMQFFSYYNSNYAVYFGFHDPDASIKYFGIKDDSGGIKIQCTLPIPNKTLAGNDWEMPGNFQLDLYNGDWYDAALIYKQWVSSFADYWPIESVEHTTRQHSIGDIGIWLQANISDATIPTMQRYIQSAVNFFDFPVGVHIYEWNDHQTDHFYPNYLPETEGLDDLIFDIQSDDNTRFMPYINGRLWDTGIGGNDIGDSIAMAYFNAEGIESATKRTNGSYYSEEFLNNRFATMCPTQTNWQDILTGVSHQLNSTNNVGAKSVYIDMICASPPVQCMDISHDHTLGGGSFWREGYKQMLTNIHDVIPTDNFITAEGGCDYLADQVDAFMVQGWMTANQVPAWQAIYTGKVQLFGTRTGANMYGDQRFYGRLSQGFIYGVQTGRQFLGLAISPNQNEDKLMAANYVKALGGLRYKLRDFMSYGEMKRPVSINGVIPNVSYTVDDWGGCRCLDTISNAAIQSSVWGNDSSIVIVFANSRIQSPAGTTGGNIEFTFDFDPSKYGLKGDLTLQKITPSLDDTIVPIRNTPFQKTITLANLDLVAYKITASNVVSVDADIQIPIVIYPNPTQNYFSVDHKNKIESINIYNRTGQLVLSTKPKNNIVDVSTIPNGLYLIVIKDKERGYTSKLIINN